MIQKSHTFDLYENLSGINKGMVDFIYRESQRNVGCEK